MSENINETKPTEPGDKQQGPPPTPFDHPLFLPVLLFAGMIWFGYDGWLTSDPDMLEHRTFNRGGFAVLTLLTAWFGYKGIREYREDRNQAARGDGQSSSGSDPDAPGSAG